MGAVMTKDEKIQAINGVFYAAKTARISTDHMICVKSPIYNLRTNSLYEFRIRDKEDGNRALSCCLDTAYANLLSVPVEGSSYCFFLTYDEETDLYHVNSYIKETDMPVFTEYLNRVGWRPDIKVISAYIKLTEEQKRSVADQLHSVKHKGNTEGVCPAPIFNSDGELLCKYELAKEHYSPESRAYIEGMFRILEKSTDTKEKHHAKQCLKYYLSINTENVEFSFSTDKLRQKIRRNLYGMDMVTERIVEILLSAKKSGNSASRILLVGSPGTGKTELVHAIACGINRPVLTIEGSAMSSGLDLIGEDKVYDKAEPGAATIQFFRAGTTNVVLLLDEVEKMGRLARDGDCYNALLSLLQGYDLYLEGRIDISSTLVIATANSIEGIPEAVINRFEIIHIPDYNFDTKIKIAQQYSIPRLIRKYHLEEDRVSIKKEVLEILVKQYCADAGMRDLEKYMEMMLQKMIVRMEEDVNGERDINQSNFKEYLTAEPDRENFRIIYNNQYEFYGKKERNEIDRLFSLLSSPSTEQKDKPAIRKKLEYHIYMNPQNEESEKVDIDTFYQTLAESHFGMEDTKKAIIRAYYSEKQPRFKFLFYGPAGTGKTSLIEAIGRTLDMPILRINCNGLCDVSLLKGTPAFYGNADSGAVIRGMAKHRTRKVLIHLDEIDKAGSRGDIESVLMELLDDSQIWNDLYLDFPISLSSVSFIGTCNSLAEINPILLDRFRLIPVTGYEPWEKKKIAYEYILPRLIHESGYDDLQIKMEDDAANELVEYFAPGNGVRNLEHSLKTAVEALIEEYLKTGKVVQKIDRDLLERELGVVGDKKACCPCKDKSAVGMARAFGVCNGVGRGMTVEATVLENEEIVITGNVEEDTKESVQVIRTLVGTLTPIYGKGIHVHFGNLGERKCGPSAGMSTFVAVYSAYAGISVPLDVGFTGEVTLKGFVTPVGGVTEKILAAKKEGCTRIYIPEQNYDRLDKEMRNQNLNISVIPVYHVKDIISAFFMKEGEQGNEV